MVGSTLPAHCTSMGRVLLAALPPSERAAWVAGCKPDARTDRTITDTAALNDALELVARQQWRSEEHTSELQSLMRISYAVFCLNKKTENTSTAKEIKDIQRQNRQPTETKIISN